MREEVVVEYENRTEEYGEGKRSMDKCSGERVQSARMIRWQVKR